MPLYTLDGIAPDLPANGDYWVAPTATVIGRVRLGAGCGIWFGAALRGDNEYITLGDNTNVQENCVLHTDMGAPLTIGTHCTLGHGAVVHGCTVGNGSLIGMGAVVLNHARLGEHCLVGAGSLVTEGKEFPPRSLIVGSPARAVRTLTDDEVAKLLASALSYAENARRFKAQLRECHS